MADPPRQQPPPLPPRPLVAEPFINELAKAGCCPFVRSGGLHGPDCSDLGRGRCTVDIGQVTAAGKPEPQPDTVRTRRDEMLPPEPLPLSEETGYALRRELVLLREALPPTRDTLSPPSKRQQAAKAVSDVAKWTTIAVGVLGVATQVAAMFRPDLVGPLQTLLKLLGGAP